MPDDDQAPAGESGPAAGNQAGLASTAILPESLGRAHRVQGPRRHRGGRDRRRLERDLHDSIQQRVVSLALKARAIATMTPRPMSQCRSDSTSAPQET